MTATAAAEVTVQHMAAEFIAETLADLRQQAPESEGPLKPGQRPEDRWDYWAGRLEGAAIIALVALEEVAA
jgi:hypothetical protein